MVIGVLEIDLLIPGNHSLKGKRSVLKSFLERVRNTFNVSVAEVGCQDLKGRAVVAVVGVGNDRRRIDSVLARIVEYARNFRDLRVLDYSQHLM